MHDNLFKLNRNFSNKFSSHRNRTAVPIEYRHGDDAFVIESHDLLDQDTLGESNTTRIFEDLGEEFPGLVHESTRPYVHDVYVRVEDLINHDDLAERVLEICEDMDNYPVYDETHFCDLENQRLQEYITETLPYDLAYELGVEVSDQLVSWISDNIETVYEYNDGSVDDMPINVEELAQEYKR